MASSTFSDNVLQSTMQSASYNVLLQVLFRILTFAMNGFVLRFISRETLGLVNVRLTLLYTTILFISREAFRKACLSQSSKSQETRWHEVINLLWLTLPLGILASVLSGYIWLNWLEKPAGEVAVKQYSICVLFYASCAVLELMAEPLWVVFQCHLFVRLKVFIEGSSVFLRCITTVVLVYYFPSLGMTAFCFAQVAQSFSYFALYYTYFYYILLNNKGTGVKEFPLKTMRDVFPCKKPGSPWINFSLMSLTWSFFQQSFLKQILTEGERYVMTLFNALTLAQQGVYDVINNIGSLAARFVFLPVEESHYLFFAQTLDRGKPALKQSENSLSIAADTLESVLKFVVLIGLTILVFGYSYSALALDMYGGAILSSGAGPTQLRCHCLYILVIAVNGITECFMFATMSQSAVDKYNQKLVLFSIIFLASSWFLTRFGAVGFIFANCLNMMLRIIHSVLYIWEYFKDAKLRPLQGLLPSKPVILGYLSSFAVMSTSETWLCCSHGWFWRLVHIFIGGVCLLTVFFIIYLTESNFVHFLRRQLFFRFRRKVE